jgi:hypothetical protein
MTEHLTNIGNLIKDAWFSGLQWVDETAASLSAYGLESWSSIEQAAASVWSSADRLTPVTIILLWSLLAVLVVAVLLCFGKRTIRFTKGLVAVGAVTGVMVLVTSYHLHGLLSQKEAALNSQIKNNQILAERLKVQLKSTQDALRDARQSLAELKVTANDLEVKLLDTKYRLIGVKGEKKPSSRDAVGCNVKNAGMDASDQPAVIAAKGRL